MLAFAAMVLTAGASGVVILIEGGEPDTKFEQVVAIMRDGQMHCSGTVIGKTVVLTAGHCVDGVPSGDLQVRVGPIARRTGPRNRYSVVGSRTYQEETERELFDGNVQAHDLSILLLGEEIRRFDSQEIMTPLQIHRGEPPIAELIGRKELRFIGFGWTESEDEQGKRRYIDLTPIDLAPLSFRNDSASKQTCRGDSGGPAVLVAENVADSLVIGVISKGLVELNEGKRCARYGTNTRVEVYSDWIEAWTG